MAEAEANHAKVLFVLPNFAGGGAERVALTLLAQLDRTQFEPEPAMLGCSDPLRGILAEDVALHVIGSALAALTGILTVDNAGIHKALEWSSTFGVDEGLAMTFRQQGPDQST